MKIDEIKKQIQHHRDLAEPFKEDMQRWGQDTEQYELSSKERYGAINYANGMKDCLEQLRPYENYYNAAKALEAYQNTGDYDPFGDEYDRLEKEIIKFDTQLQEQQ